MLRKLGEKAPLLYHWKMGLMRLALVLGPPVCERRDAQRATVANVLMVVGNLGIADVDLAL
jgi:hypothetical protein